MTNTYETLTYIICDFLSKDISNKEVKGHKAFGVFFLSSSLLFRFLFDDSLARPPSLYALEVVDQSQQSVLAGQSVQTGPFKETGAKTKCFRQRLKRGAAAMDSLRTVVCVNLLK